MVSKLDRSRKMLYAKISCPLGDAASVGGPMVKRLAVLVVSIILGLAGTVPVQAASTIALFGGPQDNSQLFSYLNTLVLSINAITGPLLPAVTGGVNSISLTSGVTGSPAVIGLQPGGDTNAGININPNGSGNISLFATTDTGVLQIANATSWFAAKGAGLVPCPGGGAKGSDLAGGLLQGGMQTVQGYEVHEDWLGRAYWLPGCR